jgi:putative oxidoreductase
MQRQHFIPTEDHLGIALLVVRLALAREFLYQGSAILFGAFHGPGIYGFAAYAHLPAVVSLLVGLAQFGGGITILTGVGARLGAAGLISVLVGALTFARIPSALATDYAITQLLTAVAVLVAGAGPYSLYPVIVRQIKIASRRRRIARAHHSEIAAQT